MFEPLSAFLIESTEKFSFEPKLKYQKIKLVCESSFLYFWKKMHGVIIDICSIKIVNLWETVLIISVYRYSFLVEDCYP